MRIAVVGGGIAGLSLAWHLLQHKGISVDLFDAKGIGGGASGASTGLMHPFVGRKARRSWQSEEGMEATKALVETVEKEEGSSLADRRGIFRPALTSEERERFLSVAKEDADALWEERSPFGGGLWIEKGMTLFTRPFLKGLWRLCEKRGASLVQERIDALDRLDSFDRVVLATGSETLHLVKKELPLKVTKGQALLCRWKEPLPFNLLAAAGHITSTKDPELCHVGSTYERTFRTAESDPQTALPLLNKVALFYPPAKEFEVVAILSGLRISPKIGYLPLVERLDTKTWLFTGFGSRAMLYAAYLAETLAEEMIR